MKDRSIARLIVASVIACVLWLLDPTPMDPPYLLHAIYTISALGVAAFIYHERPVVMVVVLWALQAAVVLRILSTIADYAGSQLIRTNSWIGEAIPLLALDLALFIIGACCGAFIKRKWLNRAKAQLAATTAR